MLASPARSLLFLACLSALPASAQVVQMLPQQSAEAAEPLGHDVLVVLMDDCSVAELSVYGLDPSVPVALTPNIDALAVNGVLFQNAWANPLCSPSRASLLTGRLPFRTGIGTTINNGTWSLSGAELTLAEAVSDYAPLRHAPGAFGKWHLRHPNGVLPCPATQVHGFDIFEGTMAAVGPGYCHWSLLSCPGASTTGSGEYEPAVIFDAARSWIAAQRGPWFCYLAPESPYEFPHVPPTSLQSIVAGTPCASCPTQNRTCWNAALQALDTKLGHLIGDLGPRWAERTTIIFTADNGTPANVNTYWPTGHTKGSLFDGGVHVPLIIAGRAVDPALRGTSTDELASLTDVFSTVTTLVGAKGLPPEVAQDSYDLTPLLSAPPAPTGRTTLVAEKFGQNQPSGPYPGHVVAVRDVQFKLIWDCSNAVPLGLYDLWADPLEVNDLLLPTPPGPGTPEGDALLSLRAEILALIGC